MEGKRSGFFAGIIPKRLDGRFLAVINAFSPPPPPQRRDLKRMCYGDFDVSQGTSTTMRAKKNASNRGDGESTLMYLPGIYCYSKDRTANR